jgi:HK97 family phage prohead protease
MKQFLTKTISDSVLDVDDSSRRVKVVIARMGNEDRDKEVIAYGAFTKTISERGPRGSNEIWHLIDHHASLAKALGKFKELYTEGDMLVGVNDSIVKNQLGNDVLALYKDGHITQHSIGFSIPKGKTEAKDGITTIQEVQLWEGSAVLWGANPETPTLSVGKSFFESEVENFQQIEENVKKIELSLRNGQYSDEMCQLMTLQKQILQSKLLTTTKPDNSTLPGVDEEEKALSNLFLTTLKANYGIFRNHQRN